MTETTSSPSSDSKKSSFPWEAWNSVEQHDGFEYPVDPSPGEGLQQHDPSPPVPQDMVQTEP